jgi:hypothetical protein
VKHLANLSGFRDARTGLDIRQQESEKAITDGLEHVHCLSPFVDSDSTAPSPATVMRQFIIGRHGQSREIAKTNI